MAAIVEGFDAGCDVLFVRVRVNLGKKRAAEARSVEDVECLIGDRQRGKAPVGHQQRLFDTRRFAGVGEFLDAPRAEADCGGVGPVGGGGHG